MKELYPSCFVVGFVLQSVNCFLLIGVFTAKSVLFISFSFVFAALASAVPVRSVLASPAFSQRSTSSSFDIWVLGGPVEL